MDRETSSSLRVAVADFGPIASADVELRPLTVFVGPSNTGKSYVAALAYVLHRFFGRGSPRFQGLNESGLFAPSHSTRFLTEAARKAIQDFARDMASPAPTGNGGMVDVPDAVAVWFRSVIAAQKGQLDVDLRRCFGQDDLASLIRKGRRGPARIVLRRLGPKDTAPFEHILTIGRTETNLEVTVPRAVPASVASGSARYPSASEVLLDVVAGPLSVPSYYLPAARTGLMDVDHNVTSATGITADFLEHLISIGRRGPPKQPDLGSQLEEQLLQGAVRAVRSTAGNYPRFQYRPKGWKEDLPLASASSMVSDLAPLVLYLRHVVHPGDLVIIEEPESHLHPEAQTALARQIVALVANGLRVLVTTHSDWMLHQFANQVRLAGLDEEYREGLAESPALRPDQFGAWLFRHAKRPRGSVVEEIPFDSDRGGLDSGYGEAADVLYNTWAEIGNRITEAKASKPG